MAGSQVGSALIQQAQRTGRLDLRKNGLQSFPTELLGLTELTYLDLSDNNIGSVPPSIVRMTNLRNLILDNCQLRSLPPELADIKALRFISLSGNSDMDATLMKVYTQGERDKNGKGRAAGGLLEFLKRNASQYAVAPAGPSAPIPSGIGSHAEEAQKRNEVRNQNRLKGQTSVNIFDMNSEPADHSKFGRVGGTRIFQNAGQSTVFAAGSPAKESAQQRLDREERERLERLAKLSDASIQQHEDDAAARRQAFLDARVAEAKHLEGHRGAGDSLDVHLQPPRSQSVPPGKSAPDQELVTRRAGPRGTVLAELNKSHWSTAQDDSAVAPIHTGKAQIKHSHGQIGHRLWSVDEPAGGDTAQQRLADARRAVAEQKQVTQAAQARVGHRLWAMDDKPAPAHHTGKGHGSQHASHESAADSQQEHHHKRIMGNAHRETGGVLPLGHVKEAPPPIHTGKAQIGHRAGQIGHRLWGQPDEVPKETVQQRLAREERERQARGAKLSDASIQQHEDDAAARRQAFLDARVAEAKHLEGGHRLAAHGSSSGGSEEFKVADAGAGAGAGGVTSMEGPFAYTNWVIKDRLLTGGAPSSRDLQTLLDLGIDTFVCLQPNDEVRKLKIDYFATLKALNRSDVAVLQLPIKDGNIPEDKALEAFVLDLVTRFSKGANIFVHCNNGHGRTSIVASLLLSLISGCKAAEALKSVQLFHDTRKHQRDHNIFDSHAQRMQVFRVLSNHGL